MQAGEQVSSHGETWAHGASPIVIGHQSARGVSPANARGFFCRLEPATLDILLRRSQMLDLAEGARVQPGDFAILTRGLLRLAQYGAEGRRRILGVTLPGEAVLPEDQRDGLTLEAATEATICLIHPSSRQAAMTVGHDFRDQFLRCVRKKQDRTHKLAVALATLGPNERLLAFLADCTAYMPWEPLPGGGGILTMLLDRQDIAALLGTTVETICRALHGFDDKGLIRILDPRHFAIPDLDRLRLQATGCATADPLMGAPCTPASPTALAAVTSVNAAGLDAR